MYNAVEISWIHYCYTRHIHSSTMVLQVEDNPPLTDISASSCKTIVRQKARDEGAPHPRNFSGGSQKMVWEVVDSFVSLLIRGPILRIDIEVPKRICVDQFAILLKLRPQYLQSSFPTQIAIRRQVVKISPSCSSQIKRSGW